MSQAGRRAASQACEIAKETTKSVCSYVKAAIAWFVSYRARDVIVVAVLYFILTIAMTYPLILFFDKGVVGFRGAGDAEYFLWYMWWMKYALVDLHTNPGVSSYLMYPNSLNLVAGDSPMNALISVFLQPILGLPGSYNALFMFGFIGSGLGVYMLLRYLGCSARASFLAGTVFAFAPYHFAHGLGGHFGLASTEWLPFFALFSIRAIRERKSRFFVLAPAAYFMAAYTASYYAVYLALFFTLILVLNWRRVSQKPFLVKLAKIGVPTSLIFAVPILLLMSDAISRHSLTSVVPSPIESIFYSADLVGFFIPSERNPFLGRYASSLASHFTGNGAEYTTSFGYTALFLAAYGMVKARRARDVASWGIVALTFLVMSLGPVLHILGRTTFTSFNVTIPLPYIVFYELLSPVRLTRVPARLSIIAMLAISVLAGFGLEYLLQRVRVLKKPSLTNVLVVMFLGLILVESAASIYVHTNPISPFYYELAKEKGDFPVLDLPQWPRGGHMIIDASTFLYEYYQTVHHKRMVGGLLPRYPEASQAFTDEAPIVSDLVYPVGCVDCKSPDIIRVDANVAQNVLGYYDIHYVILHKEILSLVSAALGDALSRDQRLVSSFFKAPPVYEDELITVYEVTPPNRFFPFLRLEKRSWNQLEVWEGVPTRWMSNDSYVTILNPDSSEVLLGFSLLSLAGERTLEVYSNDQLVTSLAITSSLSSLSFQSFQMHLSVAPQKPTMIRFHSREKCETPKSLGMSNDERCLSVAFRELYVSEVVGVVLDSTLPCNCNSNGVATIVAKFSQNLECFRRFEHRTIV